MLASSSTIFFFCPYVKDPLQLCNLYNKEKQAGYIQCIYTQLKIKAPSDGNERNPHVVKGTVTVSQCQINIRTNRKQSWQYTHCLSHASRVWHPLSLMQWYVVEGSHCILSCVRSGHSWCNSPLRTCRLALDLSWCSSWSHTLRKLRKNWGTCIKMIKKVHRNTCHVAGRCLVEKLYQGAVSEGVMVNPNPVSESPELVSEGNWSHSLFLHIVMLVVMQMCLSNIGRIGPLHLDECTRWSSMVKQNRNSSLKRPIPSKECLRSR